MTQENPYPAPGYCVWCDRDRVRCYTDDSILFQSENGKWRTFGWCADDDACVASASQVYERLYHAVNPDPRVKRILQSGWEEECKTSYKKEEGVLWYDKQSTRNGAGDADSPQQPATS